MIVAKKRTVELCPVCRDMLRYARHFETCRCRSMEAMSLPTIADKEKLCNCGWRELAKKVRT